MPLLGAPMKRLAPNSSCLSHYLRPSSSIRFSSSITLPPGSWDSHMHVTHPDKFPIRKEGQYKPHAALLSDAVANAKRLQLPNMVFVQPSYYGTNNNCLLDALKKFGGRGVVTFDPSKMGLDLLREWHDLGVRGYRINLKSVGSTPTRRQLIDLLRGRIDFLGGKYQWVSGKWVVDLFVDMSSIPHLEPIAAHLKGLKLAIAHLGSPSELKENLSDMPGWDALIALMKKNKDVYMKISAPYRVPGSDPEYKKLERMTKELFAANDEGVVFASDWPHTRFEGTDGWKWIERCHEWCGNDDMRTKLFKTNAERLWDAGEHSKNSSADDGSIFSSV